MVWLSTQQAQICHQRHRKSWREAYNLHGRVSHWPWHPSSKSFLSGKRGRQLAWALPRRIGHWVSPALELAGFKLQGEIRHLSRRNSKRTFPFNHTGFVNCLITLQTGPSWRYPLRRWLFRRQNRSWMCLQKTSAFFGWLLPLNQNLYGIYSPWQNKNIIKAERLQRLIVRNGIYKFHECVELVSERPWNNEIRSLT